MVIKYKDIDFSSCRNNHVNLYSFQYESPIERILGECMYKHINLSSISILPQVEIQTIGGLFRLDFLIVSKGKKYAVECDGREYHDYYEDLYRDTMLLSNKFIDEMIRFRGEDIILLPCVCLLILSKIIPNFITKERNEILEQEARNERWSLTEGHDSEGIHFYDEILTSDVMDYEDLKIIHCGKSMKVIFRHNRQTSHRKPEWQYALEFINEHQIRLKDEFVAKYSSRFLNDSEDF